MTISCEAHSQIEVCCMYGYAMNVLMQSGEQLFGVAVTTCIVDKQEGMHFKLINGEAKVLLLSEIESIHISSKNAGFSEITLK